MKEMRETVRTVLLISFGAVLGHLLLAHVLPDNFGNSVIFYLNHYNIGEWSSVWVLFSLYAIAIVATIVMFVVGVTHGNFGLPVWVLEALRYVVIISWFTGVFFSIFSFVIAICRVLGYL